METDVITIPVPSALKQLFDNVATIFASFQSIGNVFVGVGMWIFSLIGVKPQPWMGGTLSILFMVLAIYLTYKSTKKYVKYGILIVAGLAIFASAIAVLGSLFSISAGVGGAQSCDSLAAKNYDAGVCYPEKPVVDSATVTELGKCSNSEKCWGIKYLINATAPEIS